MEMTPQKGGGGEEIHFPIEGDFPEVKPNQG
jgi:hypothetical protein